MISTKKAEVLGRSWEVPKQLKKLEKKVKGEFYWALSEFQCLNFHLRRDHFQISFNECSSDGKGVDNHSCALIKKKGENNNFPFDLS